MAETHVALLRGINVGGKNTVPMKELRRRRRGERTHLKPERERRVHGAIAIEHGLVVYTRDAHFGIVPGLALR